MEIVYYFKDYSIPMYQQQHVHIIDELKRHDCNVSIVSPLDYSSIEKANDALLRYISNNKVDLFMTPHGNKDLYIETLAEIENSEFQHY